MFTLVLPTYNRGFCICDAVDSVLRQTYGDWELIIVDDGSTDGTMDVLQKRYAEQIESGRIVYLRQGNAGVCRARNTGLAAARGEWIVYVDSDNTIRTDHLQTFAEAIRANPQARTFYSKFVTVSGGAEKGRPFDRLGLLERNFIDLGVFVHHRSLYERLGGFDEAFRRLVDWELIIRYTNCERPVFVDRVLMDYNDSNEFKRITGSWNGNMDWKAAVLQKHGGEFPFVSTVITTYNQKDYIAKALDSAMSQEGLFRREIVVSDDGSNDGTREIVDRYARDYPHLIRNVSVDVNAGPSANLKRCLDAACGDFIAVLEGDDYWTDKRKLSRQVGFLVDNPTSPMVFSKIEICDEATGTRRYAKIQQNLPNLLRGRDFFAAGSSSVIINFSCCMFRAEAIRSLPDAVWNPRPSEIALAFHLEQFGPIGFIAEPMSVYLVRKGSLWSGSDPLERRRQEITCRRMAMKVCAPKYLKDFEREIERIDQVLALKTAAASAHGWWRKLSCLTRGGVTCLRENGWRYTASHAFEKFIQWWR